MQMCSLNNGNNVSWEHVLFHTWLCSQPCMGAGHRAVWKFTRACLIFDLQCPDKCHQDQGVCFFFHLCKIHGLLALVLWRYANIYAIIQNGKCLFEYLFTLTDLIPHKQSYWTGMGPRKLLLTEWEKTQTTGGYNSVIDTRYAINPSTKSGLSRMPKEGLRWQTV